MIYLLAGFMIFEAISFSFSFVAKYCQVQHWRPFKVTSLRTLKFRLLCQRIWQSFTTLLQLNNSPSQRECYKWQIRVFFVWLKVDQLAPSKIIHLHCRSCSVPLSLWKLIIKSPKLQSCSMLFTFSGDYKTLFSVLFQIFFKPFHLFRWL